MFLPQQIINIFVFFLQSLSGLILKYAVFIIFWVFFKSKFWPRRIQLVPRSKSKNFIDDGLACLCNNNLFLN